jgi:hypothetical protein
MSFGVGNEVEGQARIDHVIDSVLALHPDLVFTISAGNDGPGLSTVGFPGSAQRAIGVGATLPGSFLPGPPGTKREDQLAYFSSRGGELAKPELVTPGVAYSAVPLWNTGQEIAQGTSMAAPHAAGLVALLISGAVQEKRALDARSIKQALMVTARPLPGGTFVDQGTGLPDLERAYQWLRGDRKVADIRVRAVGNDGVNAAFRELGSAARPAAAQQFELLRPADASPATYNLKTDAPWISAPARVTLSGPKSVVEIRYDFSSLQSPGAYTGTVAGWGADSLAGPAFRLVSTVIAPAPVAPAARELRSNSRIEFGGSLRTFFRADSARPFQVRVTGGGPTEKGLAFLHEPDGMPYREESARPVGGPEGAALYQVDGRDAVAGAYEAVAQSVTPQGLTAGVRVTHSPVRLHLARRESEAIATLSNVTTAPVKAEVGMVLGGGERVETVVARGSAVRRIPFVAPAWARSVVVDITMDRTQWGRFTDFGVTLFDSVGRQIEKEPLNYAFGRLEASLPEGHPAMPLELRLFPGFADAGGDEHWTLRASIRLYADSAVVLDLPPAGQAPVTIAPGKNASFSFPLPHSPWALGDGFFPLGVLVVRAAENTWTRESGLPLPNPPIMR